MISSPMKCPHCFLELIITSQYDKELDQCPKCEGIWLDGDNSKNIFDFTDDGDKKYKLLRIFKKERILLMKIRIINSRMIIIIKPCILSISIWMIQ